MVYHTVEYYIAIKRGKVLICAPTWINLWKYCSKSKSVSHKRPYIIWFYLYKMSMATHSSILAWRISWTEEPGRLQSMGLQRVGHNWSDSYTHTHTICLQQIHLQRQSRLVVTKDWKKGGKQTDWFWGLEGGDKNILKLNVVILHNSILKTTELNYRN